MYWTVVVLFACSVVVCVCVCVGVSMSDVFAYLFLIIPNRMLDIFKDPTARGVAEKGT